MSNSGNAALNVAGNCGSKSLGSAGKQEMCSAGCAAIEQTALKAIFTRQCSLFNAITPSVAHCAKPNRMARNNAVHKRVVLSLGRRQPNSMACLYHSASICGNGFLPLTSSHKQQS